MAEIVVISAEKASSVMADSEMMIEATSMTSDNLEGPGLKNKENIQEGLKLGNHENHMEISSSAPRNEVPEVVEVLQSSPLCQIPGQAQDPSQEARGRPQAASAPTTPGHYDPGHHGSGYQTPAPRGHPGLGVIPGKSISDLRIPELATHPGIRLTKQTSSVQDPIDQENNIRNDHNDIGERVFRFFLDLRLQEENIKLKMRNEYQDVSKEVQSAVRDIIDRLTRLKGRIKVWQHASRIRLQSLSKESLRSLFLNIFQKASHYSKWFLFFFLSDLILLSTSVEQNKEEHLILWSCELIRDIVSPYVRENSGWKFFLFIRSEDPMTDQSGSESEESEYEDVEDYHGTFHWNSEMDSIVKKTLRRAVTKEKKYKDQRRNYSYKHLWVKEFRRYFRSFPLNNKTKNLLRAKYSGSKKHKIQKKHTIMSKKFLQYLKLSVQTLLTKKKTTTCDEVIKFIQETKEKDLEMVSYKKRNVRRSINRAMDNFKKTGSTSRKHPGRPPCPDPLRKKICSLSRNKRYRR